MSVNPINFANIRINSTVLNSQIRELEFGKAKKEAESRKWSKALKPAILATTGIGVLSAMALLKNVAYKGAGINYKNPLTIIAIAAGSILGGLLGGLALDKENRQAKVEESIAQMVGNITIPVASVFMVNKFAKSLKLEDKMPQLKEVGKFTKGLNGTLKLLPEIAFSIGALMVAIKGGNLFANKMNEKIFNKKEKRDVRVTDFSAHIDDMCMVSTLIAPKNDICNTIGKFIPLALMVAGYETGTAKKGQATGHK